MDIMVDLETLDVTPSAVILTIGAIRFDPQGRLKALKDYDYFYKRIEISKQEQLGFTTSQKTKDWWNKQEDKVKNEAFGGTSDIEKVIREFNDWVKKSGVDFRIWSRGTAFDIPILEHAFRKFNIEYPWKFWNVMDMRTVATITGTPTTQHKNGKHNALTDCYRQIADLYNCIYNMNREYR